MNGFKHYMYARKKVSLRFCWQAVLSIECKWCSNCLHAIRLAWWRMKCSCLYLTWIEKHSVVIRRSEVSHPSVILKMILTQLISTHGLVPIRRIITSIPYLFLTTFLAFNPFFGDLIQHHCCRLNQINDIVRWFRKSRRGCFIAKENIRIKWIGLHKSHDTATE